MTQPGRKPDTTRPGSRAGPEGPPLEALDFERARVLPERHLGRFVVTAELGRGGMGVVYRGVDPELQRPVAIKLLWGGRSGRRFATEAHTAARIRHPHVVRVHEIGQREDDGAAYLVMDFVEGETLADRVEREGPLSPTEAARITMQLAGALAAAHTQGVLHRDVKPSNVLLSEAGAQLSDFGLAKDLAAQPGGLSADGCFLGTPGYAPPEQATGALAQIGPHSDVYGLGATFYFALTGESPIPIGSLSETVIATCALEPRRPSRERPGIDPALETICLRCLAKDPADRPASASALEAELAELLGAPPPAGRALGRWALIAGLLLLAGLAAGGATAWLTRPAPGRTQAGPSPSPVVSDPRAAAVAAAEAALVEGDGSAALTALMLPREVDQVDPALLGLAERAVLLDPTAATDRLQALPGGTTRDHLRTLAALGSGQLDPLQAELRRAPDRYRRQLSAALELEQRCREIEGLLEPLDLPASRQFYEYTDRVEQAGLVLFAETERLLGGEASLPAALVAVLRPRCDMTLAMLLVNFGDALRASPKLLEAGRLYRPRCSPELEPAFAVGLFALGLLGSPAPALSELPQLDSFALPDPLLAFLHYRWTYDQLRGDEAIARAEEALRLLNAHPTVDGRFSSARIEQRLLLIRLHRLRALRGLEQRPDPTGPDMQRALELGEATLHETHDEEVRVEHALTLLAAGQPDEPVAELLGFVHQAANHVYQKGLLQAELALRAGEPTAARAVLDALPEGTNAEVFAVDTFSLRAHTLALLGEQEASERARQRALAAGAAPLLWIPWRDPRRLPELLSGEAWWPGAR